MARQTKKDKEEQARLEQEQALAQETKEATAQAPEAETVATPEPPVPVLLSTGKWAVGPTTTILCQDCGAERIIKIQDAFQVTRCAACQKKAQNKKRAAKKKARNQEASRNRKLEEARKLLMEAGELPQANQD